MVKSLTEKENRGEIMAIPKYQYIKDELKNKIISRARKHKLVEFSDVEVFETKDDKVTVLSIERGNKLSYLEKLGLRGNQFYYKIERVRETNGVVYIYHTSYIPEQYINANYPNLEYYSSIYNRFKLDYHIHMNDEHFEEINEIAFPTPEHAASVLGVDEQFPSVLQTKTTKLESTGQVLAYSEESLSLIAWAFFYDYYIPSKLYFLYVNEDRLNLFKFY